MALKSVILSSGSEGATQEDIERVLAGHGLEVEKEEKTADEGEKQEEEPKRDDFDSEEDFEEAHVAWQDKTAKAKDEDDEEDEDEEEERPKPKLSKFKRRIERAVEPFRRENADLRRRLEALEKGGKKEDEPDGKRAAADPNPRPDRAKFKAEGKTDEEYEDALLAWGVAKTQAEAAAKEAATKQRERLDQNLRAYRSQVEEFKDEHDDWDEVVNRDDIPMHTGVQLAVMELENAAEVIYYLGRHPAYATKLAEMSEPSAIMEVGRLSSRLKPVSGSRRSTSGREDTTPKPKRKAADVIEPVNTGATSSTVTSRDAAKSGNYKAFKQAQRLGR